MTPAEEKVEILLIEDNPGDVRLIKEGLKDSRVINHIHVVQDGEEATNFLFKNNGYKDVPTPDIILLDLNLPKKDGRALLADIKKDEQLQRIPIVILTSSKAEAGYRYGLSAPRQQLSQETSRPFRVRRHDPVLRAVLADPGDPAQEMQVTRFLPVAGLVPIREGVTLPPESFLCDCSCL